MARKVLKDESGVAATEFAILFIPLMAMIMGGIELGYRLFAISVGNGALRDAARMASTGGFTGTEIDNRVTASILKFRPYQNVTIVKKAYSDFTGVGLPEPLTSGSVASGTYCYKDINDNGSWDSDQGSSGLGGPEDVIYYEVTFDYPPLFDLTETLFSLPPAIVVSQNAIVSNEPFAASTPTVPTTRCV